MESNLFRLDSSCPDLFELPVDGTAANKNWVIHAANSQYAIGGFDGTTFTIFCKNDGDYRQIHKRPWD